MKLCANFEVARAALLNRNLVPDLEVCVGEHFHEEQRLLTQTTYLLTRVLLMLSQSHIQPKIQSADVIHDVSNIFSINSLVILLTDATRNYATTANNMVTLLSSFP